MVEYIPLSADWFELRSKCAWTASLAPSLAGSHDRYLRGQKLIDKVQGIPDPPYTGPHLEWGRTGEKNAIRSLINLIKNEVGVVKKKKDLFFQKKIEAHTGSTLLLGATPDATLEYGGHLWNVEIKCPYSKRADRHPKFTVPLKYYIQIQQQLFCSGTENGILYQWAPHGDNMVHVHRHRRIWDEVLLPRMVEAYEGCLGVMRASLPKRALLHFPEGFLYYVGRPEAEFPKEFFDPSSWIRSSKNPQKRQRRQKGQVVTPQTLPRLLQETTLGQT